MTHYTQYLKHHVDLLQQFKTASEKLPPFIQTKENNEDDVEWLGALDQLCNMNDHNEELNRQGQRLVLRVVSTYSHLMSLLSRDLLWFFGGDCLHYMPDEEIDFFQQLDELRFSAEAAGHSFDYAAAKEHLVKTH
ncbi:MAG: hypothetical protein ACJATV_000005 [Granulosicoccus sp.]|jgi:hypothetical protein